VPEVDLGVPQVGQRQQSGRGRGRLGQRGQGQPVHLRRERSAPAEPVAVGPGSPCGGGAGRTAQPGQQGADRCGQPRRRSREPGRGAQQVDGEVSGELDRRLELVVHGPVDRGSGRPGRDRCGGRRGDADGAVRSGPEPVDPQWGRPPGEVRAVRAGSPGGDTAAQLAPPGPGRRTGDRDGTRVDPEHPDGQADGEPDGEVRGASGELHRAGGRGACAEQAGATGTRGGGQVGPQDGCRLDRHVPPSREVVAAAGEGTAGKEKDRDAGARGPAPGTPWAGCVTEPLRDPLRAVDDPPPGPVTCRHPDGKTQVRPAISGR
jgi:hypothetical protein